MATIQRQPNWSGRSFFWPLMLIGVGVVWLLSNAGILQPASLGVLFRLWPLILIVIGLDLLFGRRSARLGTLIGVGGVALILGLMLVGPSLGWAQGAKAKEAIYDELLGDTTAATVNLNVSVAETTVNALTDSPNLFEADLRYIGDITYNVSGETEKQITLSQQDQEFKGFNFWDWNFFSDHDLRWNIGLSNSVPINLSVSGGVNNSILNLEDVKLTHLQIDSGVGSIDLSVPAMPDLYNVDIKGGTGSTEIQVEEGAAINFTIEGGVGSVTVDVPKGTAVRLEASTGVGKIDVPSDYIRSSGSEDNVVGDEGVWQTEGFENADRAVTIHYEGGVGTFTIH